MRVSWTEGVFTQEIQRLTYGFDVNAVAGLLENLAPSEDSEGEDAEGEDRGGFRNPPPPSSAGARS